MPLGPTFQKIVDNSGGQILNYDYVDIAAGTGYVDYYLGTTAINGASGAIMSNQSFYSNWVTTNSNVVADVTPAKVHDIDFDLLFNKSSVVRGNAIVNIPFGIKEIADNGYLSYIQTRLRKWDGTTETEIAQASGAILTKGAGGTNTYGYSMSAIEMTVPQTIIKKGETLRLTVEQWAICEAGPNNTYFFFGHSPKNRATITGDEITWGTEPSIATIKIPYRLDLS